MSLVFTPLRSTVSVAPWFPHRAPAEPSHELPTIVAATEDVEATAAEEDAAPTFEPARATEMMGQASDLLDELRDRCRSLTEKAESAALLDSQEVANAHLATAIWKKTAEVKEARVRDLQARLTDANATARELREQLLCIGVTFAAAAGSIRAKTRAPATIEVPPLPDIMDLRLVHAA